MNPVTQTRFGTEGNCLQACIASILELPIEEVPDAGEIHRAGKSWRHELNRWLVGRGLWFATLKIGGGWDMLIPPTYHIIGGTSPRGTEDGHCVVGFQGKIVFDPHPDNTGLDQWEEYTFLLRLFPQ